MRAVLETGYFVNYKCGLPKTRHPSLTTLKRSLNVMINNYSIS